MNATEAVKEPTWRAQEKSPDGTIIRFTGHGLFDELVVSGLLHLEFLDENVWHLRVGDAGIIIAKMADGTVEVDVRRGVNGVVRGETTIETTG